MTFTGGVRNPYLSSAAESFAVVCRANHGMNPTRTGNRAGFQRSVYVAAFLIVALAGWALWRWMAGPDDVRVTDVGLASKVADDTEPAKYEVKPLAPPPIAEEARPRPTSPLPELPDASAPLSQQLPALLVRAEAGDPGASCRLIVGINRCVELNRSRAFSERMIRNMELRESEKDELLIRLAAKFEETQSQDGGFCRDVDTKTLPRTDSLLQNSIHSMSPEQKTILALMRSDGHLRRLQRTSSFSESGLYVFPQILADHSHAFLLAGFDARVPLALEGLVITHSPGGGTMTQGVHVALPNPQLFHRYALLMERLFGSASLGREGGFLLEAVTATLSPDVVSKNERWVSSEYRRWTQINRSIDDRFGIATTGDAPTVQRLCAE